MACLGFVWYRNKPINFEKSEQGVGLQTPKSSFVCKITKIPTHVQIGKKLKPRVYCEEANLKFAWFVSKAKANPISYQQTLKSASWTLISNSWCVCLFVSFHSFSKNLINL